MLLDFDWLYDTVFHHISDLAVVDVDSAPETLRLVRSSEGHQYVDLVEPRIV